jgi:hypothetical protein
MLLEIFPHLEIRGVDYIDTKLLEGTEDEYLLKDTDLLLTDGTISSVNSNQETATKEVDNTTVSQNS